jgi:tetratricopeptide (TPR) repeat protein
MNTTPIRALAQLHYVRKEFDASLKYIQLFAQIEPTNPEANTSLVALYQELGKTDDALKSVDELTKSDPKNKYAWAQYGDLLQNMSRYQESIDKYEKALEIDPTYEFVLRNIASAYKNLAGDVQRKQQDKIEADSKYKPDYEEYFPHLRKSAEYFSRAMKTPEFANDFQVMGELANIYTVLDQANELKQILNKLEAVESSVPKNKRDQYYLILMKIYGDLKESQKLQEVRAKYDNL